MPCVFFIMITKEKVIKALKECSDPELRIDVYTLGLVYDIQIEKENVFIKMTFTTPACPYAPMILQSIKEKVEQAGARKVEIELVFDPPWKPSEEIRAMLGV